METKTIRKKIYKYFFVSLLFFLSMRYTKNMMYVAEYSYSFVVSQVLSLYTGIQNKLSITYEKKQRYNILQKKYSDLQRQYNELLNQYVELALLINEDTRNNFLQSEKNKSNIPEAISANIILKTCIPKEKSYLVDKGALHGVETNMIVVSGKHLIGKIISVNSWFSKVQLITDPLFHIAVQCVQSNIKGVLEGSELCFASQKDLIKKGEVCVSLGKGLVFPAGFCLGYVNQVEGEGVDKKFFVKSFIDLACQECCSIVSREIIEKENK